MDLAYLQGCGVASALNVRQGQVSPLRFPSLSLTVLNHTISFH